MESCVDDPVEVVGEDADVAVFSQWSIGNEFDVLTSSDDRLAFIGR